MKKFRSTNEKLTFACPRERYDKSIATPPNNSRNSSLPRFREIPGKAGSNKNRDQGIWSEWGKLKTGAYDPPPSSLRFLPSYTRDDNNNKRRRKAETFPSPLKRLKNTSCSLQVQLYVSV